MSDVSEIPRIAEPFFLAFNAKVEIHPAMNAQDLARALPAIEQAVKKYGTAVQTLDARTEPLARAEATAAHDRVPSTWIASCQNRDMARSAEW